MTNTSIESQFSAVQQLLAKYTWCHDSRDFSELATCFTDDAQYTMRIAEGEASGATVGGAAIAALVEKFKSTQTDQRRHLITNVVIDSATDDTIVARSYVTVFATEGNTSSLITTGSCRDELARQEDGVWKFTRKDMHLDKGF